MPKQTPSYTVIDGLKGSELHHDLKNRPGEQGDPNHAERASDRDADPHYSSDQTS